MTGKTIGLEGRLYDYYAAHGYREPEILKELRAETARLGGLSQMQIGPEQEQNAFSRLAPSPAIRLWPWRLRAT
jgi:hypothetical protein